MEEYILRDNEEHVSDLSESSDSEDEIKQTRQRLGLVK
jgi:hypothetical protein